MPYRFGLWEYAVIGGILLVSFLLLKLPHLTRFTDRLKEEFRAAARGGGGTTEEPGLGKSHSGKTTAG